MTKEALMTRDEIVILAAMFAVTNMGQAMPDVDVVRQLRRTKKVDLGSAVMCVAEQYMESDEHQDWFMEEAQSWVKQLKAKKTMAAVREIWPRQVERFDEAA